MAHPHSDSLNGQMGSWRILDHLGSGGFADVHTVLDTETGRVGALKRPRVTHDTKADQLRARSIASEAQVLAALGRKGVSGAPQLLEILADGQGFIMEKVEGLTLSLCLKRCCSADAVAALFIAVCCALEEAHRAGWVHGDLKASNIIIQETAKGPRATIIDWGAAVPQGTRFGPEDGFIGTAELASPERVQAALGREARITAASDLWSLAVMLHQALTGQRLFRGDRSPEIMAKVLTQPIAVAKARVPAHLREVLGRALVRNPSLRITSASAFAYSLSPRAKTPTDVPAPFDPFRLSGWQARARAAGLNVSAA